MKIDRQNVQKENKYKDVKKRQKYVINQKNDRQTEI